MSDALHSRARHRSAVSLLGAGALLSPIALATIEAATSAPASAGTTFIVTNLDPSGGGSLADAIAAAESTVGVDTIVFDASLSGTITTTTEFALAESLTIEGDDRITIDGADDHRHFALGNDDVTLTIRNTTLTHGRAIEGGSVFSRSGGDLVAEGVRFIDNKATSAGARAGGAVSLVTYASDDSSNARIIGSVLSGNRAIGFRGGDGAIVVESSGTVLVDHTSITGNTAEFSDGGGNFVGDSVTISNSVISDNRVLDAENSLNVTGGIVVTSSNGTIDDTSFSGNSGVALSVFGADSGSTSIRDTRVLSGRFGIIMSQSAPMTIERSSITGTTVAGVKSYTCDAQVFLDQVTIADNAGAGLQLDDNTGYYCAREVTTVRHSTITRNGIGVALPENRIMPSAPVLDHTIVAANGTDLEVDAHASWSLIGNANGHLLTSSHVLVGLDPKLSPLVADPRTGLGVCTFDATSPAFNAGDPDFAPPPMLDEIGQPRVAFGRIDIGAWELPDAPITPVFTG